MGTQGDFTITGYSSDSAMKDFVDGSSSITEGEMFAEGTADNTCVISSELASYNDLAVGDTITLSNPNQEDETYTLTIAGIYETESTSDSASSMMGGFMAGADSSNQIYVSYQTLETILTQSEENATTTTDSTTGETTTTALRSMLNGTYAFDSMSDYEKFQDEVKEMGLSDDYTVSSSDLTSYEESLEPLQHLSEYAGYFLMVILAIGAVILIVLHIFAIRERKYEIGVLAAIGMKKWKIAVQFLTESLCITFCALIIGAGIGAVSSVPVTNHLLAQQIESSSSFGQEQWFGRETGAQGSTEAPEQPGGSKEKAEAPEVSNAGGPGFAQAANYVSSISSATDMQVILEMMGIGILLTLISGCTALIFIMRYDPLKILSNRGGRKMSILELNQVSYSYEKKGNQVLSDISYSFEKGKLYAITGRSGAGKTTLLSLICGLATPTSGSILLNGKDISSLNRYDYRSHDIGVIFQSFNLLPKLTARENVILSMDIAGYPCEDKKAHADEVLKKVALGQKEADRRILKLSGGQQRVAIARALSYSPQILVADEPTGNLDPDTQNEIMKIFLNLAHEDGRCVILVTHSKEVAAAADEVYRL